ncbi:MAG: hypothetical protein FWE16_04710 [Firmicutes bacterium]|nr:hypothetical protein [Bacillota bacterium]
MKSQIIDQLIISSRVRFARNLDSIPFKTTQQNVFEPISITIKQKNTGFISCRIDQLSDKVAHALYEQHLLSHNILSNKQNGMIVTHEDKEKNRRTCIMLGEEDHIRIQVIELGLGLNPAHAIAKKISNDIEKSHKIAHTDELGYLTSCPTNLGTAMRASIMMFLPALTKTKQIEKIINNLRGQRITIRGVHGEGSQAVGYMYQISNQACLGLTEEQIIEKVAEITTKIANLEIQVQQDIFTSSPDEITDQIMRSFGILSHAHMISSDEATEHLAWLKLGHCLGIIKFKPRVLDDLFFLIQPATISTQNERAESPQTRDKIRAKKISTVLRTSRI